MSQANKDLIQQYYLQLYSPACTLAITNHLDSSYVEHQYTANFSREGLITYIQLRLAENANHKVIIHKTLAQDDRVFLLVEEKLGHGIDIARAEMFRLANGKIVEHWGGHVIDEKTRKNNNGTFNGPQPDPSLDYSHKYAADFLALDMCAFDDQQIECFYQTRTNDYIQHSPKGGDGIEGLVSILQKAKDNGIKVSMNPGQVLIEGDFIVCHRLYDTDPKHPLMNRINTFDIFRFNAAGKAVEHWDVMEDLPEQWMLAKVF